MPLFGGKHKTAAELVKTVREALAVLAETDAKDDKKSAKLVEDISKCLESMKVMLCGSGDHEPNVEASQQLCTELCSSQIILMLLENMQLIDFEGRKDLVLIFNNWLRRQVGTRHPSVEYVSQHRPVLTSLMTGYKNQELALICGVMLRECFRYEELAKMVMLSEDFYRFFDYVEVSKFDISSDAFLTFKELLTKHKMLSAEFLEANYDRVFTQYQQLLNSENYVTRRQALKLLGELLVERRNFSVMTRYIGQTDNLKHVMNMLKEESKNIQFEAFHVFKIFVANPDKPRSIQDILLRNKDRLVDFLSRFHNDRSEDEQFNDEKSYVIKQIRDLKPLPTDPAVAAASSTHGTTPATATSAGTASTGAAAPAGNAAAANNTAACSKSASSQPVTTSIEHSATHS